MKMLTMIILIVISLIRYYTQNPHKHSFSCMRLYSTDTWNDTLIMTAFIYDGNHNYRHLALNEIKQHSSKLKLITAAQTAASKCKTDKTNTS